MAATDSSEAPDFDVIVVGGGPGGSTAATMVALDGHRVLLLEKESFPRYQIGESLLPSTIHGVCRLTGVADDLAKAGFTLKRGGPLRGGGKPRPVAFLVLGPQEARQPYVLRLPGRADEVRQDPAGQRAQQGRGG